MVSATFQILKLTQLNELENMKEKEFKSNNTKGRRYPEQ